MRASRPFFKKLEATNPRSQGKTPLEHRVRADQGSRLMKGKRQSAVAPLDLFAPRATDQFPLCFFEPHDVPIASIREHILYRRIHFI